MPSLRERRADILELARTSSSATGRRDRCGCRRPRATRWSTYDWPGNVRELERLIERAVALAESDVIELDDLPPTVRGDYADGAGAVASPERHPARLGEPLRAPGARSLRGQQARSLPRARHQLSHAAGVPAIPSARRGGHGRGVMALAAEAGAAEVVSTMTAGATAPQTPGVSGELGKRDKAAGRCEVARFSHASCEERRK